MEGPGVAPGPVERALREDPTSFGFFTAVRTLERLRPGRAGVGGFADPADEVVRFSVQPSLAFPPSEVHALEVPEEGPARMVVSFLGLTGPQGVLPHHYTLLVAERRRARDGAFGSFLDLFHHRLLSLFYRAWEKYRFTVQHERSGHDHLREHLLDLVGLGPAALRDRLPVSDDALVSHAALLGLQPRGAVALEQLLEDCFGVPAEVEQFVGGWYSLPERDRCRLDDDPGRAGRLGHDSVAGDAVWDRQTRIRIRLGPLDRTQYADFLPTGSANRALSGLVRFFTHDQFEVDLQLVLARDQLRGLVVGGDEDQPLGWSTWLHTRPAERDADDTLLTLGSGGHS